MSCSPPPGQMVEQALAKELLSSTSSPNLSYLYYLAQFQLLRGNYPSAAANLKEVLVHSNQVLTTLRVAYALVIVHCGVFTKS